MINIPKITGYRSRVINALIDAVKGAEIVSVIGGKLKQTPEGKTLIIDSVGLGSESKKPWGVKSVVGSVLTLENCYFQWGRELKKAADLTLSLVDGEYDVYAMLALDTAACKLSTDPTDDSDEQLFPVAIYRVKVAITSGSASVEFILNYSGSQVVIMS